MTLSEELLWRGFVQQSTFEDIKDIDALDLTFYHGFDASADSQTIGNLAAMMLDKVFIRHGAKAILLAGGATSLIGDPGGKDAERQLQAEETIARNVEAAENQLKKIFTGSDFTMVNNIDWTKNMSVLEFLRDIGKHFSMTPLLQRDYIATRIGEGGAGISYTEFSYTLLQGMDYLHLFDNYGCNLQIGGSDQWGNCISGVDLIRKARGKEVHCITLPLVINQATGKKFGKSEEGAVWLDENKTTPFKFYQFWLNVDDDGVEYYMKIYTELNKDEVDSIVSEHQQNPAQRIGQKRLAYEVTRLLHGTERADSVKRISEVLFGNGDYDALTANDMEQLSKELATKSVNTNASLLDFLVDTGLATSKGNARRFISDGAVYLNGTQTNPSDVSFANHAPVAGHVIVRRGKNLFALANITD